MPITGEPQTIEVCIDCVTLLANGEVTDSLGEDITFEHAAKVERTWGTARLTLGSVDEEEREPWFSSLPCKGCGTALAGDRTYATAWVALAPEEVAGAQ